MWPPTGLMWPFLLSVVLLAGVISAITCLKAREKLIPYFTVEPVAFAEACIALAADFAAPPSLKILHRSAYCLRG